MLAPDRDDVLLLAPETLEVVDRLRLPAPADTQAWDAVGMTLVLSHQRSAVGGGAALTLVNFRRARVSGPLEAPCPLDETPPVALEGGVALADRAGRRLLVADLMWGRLDVRAVLLDLEPLAVARSLDGRFLAVSGAPGEGIVVVEPQTGVVVGRWGADGEAEGPLGALAAGPTTGTWLVSERVTGAVLLVAPGSRQPLRARWTAPGPLERGRLPHVRLLVSAPGSALVWALYGAPGAPVGVAIFDVGAGRQVAWRRRMSGNLPLDLTSLALDPLGRCLYGVRAIADDAAEALVMTPLMTRVQARLPLVGQAGAVALAARPRPDTTL